MAQGFHKELCQAMQVPMFVGLLKKGASSSAIAINSGVELVEPVSANSVSTNYRFTALEGTAFSASQYNVIAGFDTNDSR